VSSSPGPGDVGDDRDKACIFDSDRGETGDTHGPAGCMAPLSSVAAADTPADVCHPDRMNVQHGPATSDAIGAAVRAYRTTTKPTRRDL
jgi:hypothetical protein